MRTGSASPLVAFIAFVAVALGAPAWAGDDGASAEPVEVEESRPDARQGARDGKQNSREGAREGRQDAR